MQYFLSVFFSNDERNALRLHPKVMDSHRANYEEWVLDGHTATEFTDLETPQEDIE